MQAAAIAFVLRQQELKAEVEAEALINSKSQSELKNGLKSPKVRSSSWNQKVMFLICS